LQPNPREGNQAGGRGRQRRERTPNKNRVAAGGRESSKKMTHI
uniref:Uncharacterized protein n=1 Tax=Aegilops tauschii subsp. strangulata TaxID=200361 RepID=A0A453A1X1_AEGTS